ncbi:MAG: hypothetical protein V4487_03075 [Chlamydiota bacterium]
MEKTGTESCSNHSLAVIYQMHQTLQTIINDSTSKEISKRICSRSLSEMRMAQLLQMRKSESSPVPEILAAPVYRPLDPRIHYLDSYSPYEYTIQLEDGSSWSVHYADMYKVRAWASNDELSISPYGFFGNDYRITNHVTNDSIIVNLVLEPIPFGPCTHWIVDIDDRLGRVYLENGTYWDVRGADRFLLAEWDVYDTVILGDGRNEWFGRNDFILINVDLNHYVYANRGA